MKKGLVLSKVILFGILYIFFAGQQVKAPGGYISLSLEPIDSLYDAIMLHKKEGKTFALELKKKTGSSRLKWKITDVQTYVGLSSFDPFCDIVAGRAKARMLFADEYHIGIFSLHKAKAEHTRIMIIPRQHSRDVTEMSKKELQAILLKGVQIASQLGSSDYYTLRTHCGGPLQTVPHLHLHLFAYGSRPKCPLFDVIPLKRWHGTLFNDIEKYVEQAQK